MAEGRRGREGRLVGTALPGAVATLLPKLRKVEALKRFTALLPAELQGLAAPHEIRLAPPAERSPGQPAAAGTQVSTLFVYTASATVGAVLEQQAPRLLAELNAQLPYPLAEALRCEPANAQKIQQQLNNLALKPD
jgi:hypothetical protein